MKFALLLTLLSADPRKTVSAVPCETVSECWLSADGKPIARPAKFRGAPIPRGNCGSRINWLRNRLSCEARLCVASLIGDKC